MKILQIDIKGFGKFEDFSVEPSQGFNLVFGLNESGKSTLQAFVLAMIYGLTKTEREKYNPWHATEFAGSMLYMLDDGSVYKAERDFRNSSFYLHDGKGQLVSTDSRECERQLGLDADLFKASAYMEQSKVMFDDPLKEKINKRLKKLYKYESDPVKTDEEKQDDASGYTNEIHILAKKIQIIKRNYDDIIKLKSQKNTIIDSVEKTGEDTPELLDELIAIKNKQLALTTKKNFMLIPFFILCLAAVVFGIYSYQAALGILAGAFIILIANGIILLSRKLRKRKLDKKFAQKVEIIGMDKETELSTLLEMKHDRDKNADRSYDLEDEDDTNEDIAIKFAAIKLNADKEINAIEDVPVYIKELEELIKEYSKSDGDQQSHKLAEKVIKAAGAEKAMQHLSDELTRIIRLITSDRYERFLSENRDFMLFSSDTESYTDIDTLSTGTMEQLYIALRLAVTELLSRKGEKLPVFMDEVFAHTDEKRIYDTVRFLKTQAIPAQIFYFTCRRTEGSLIRAIIGEETNIIKLKV